MAMNDSEGRPLPDVVTAWYIITHQSPMKTILSCRHSNPGNLTLKYSCPGFFFASGIAKHWSGDNGQLHNGVGQAAESLVMARVNFSAHATVMETVSAYCS